MAKRCLKKIKRKCFTLKAAEVLILAALYNTLKVIQKFNCLYRYIKYIISAINYAIAEN